MRAWLLILLLPFGLSGCFYSGSRPVVVQPPANTTVICPNGATTC